MSEHTHNHDHDHNHEEEQFVTIIDEDGNEELYQILFTFDSEDFGKSYVLLYPAGTSEDDDVEIQAYAFKENEEGGAGDLLPIETEEEWDMVEEVLNTFMEDENLA
ncbi:DUF1292 domain-containing protein [Carnobacteriaceae bacterium zg-ZUI252]|nr:DUF1292 domain-containing protein [Carnobacteriaceae bacterium zg-ZUI252]MBS4769758.1 DUF1292 domain-containing protein [Carnobacteriaceae bacterium zg-ZUI240]QTU83167.1 DUF1292 domain-containing protein [Carnobacteriaceae bacterium zg-C25]